MHIPASDQTFTMTIDGRPVAGATEFNVTNPVTGTFLALAPHCSDEQLDQAVAAARAAFPAWAALALEDRRQYLRTMADTIEAHTELLADLVVQEQGKPRPVARAEVAGLAYWLRATADIPLVETVNQDDSERRSITRHVPLGVVAAITPWNYPLGQASFKLGPALLAGNTVILKPSAFTPLANLKLGEVLREVLPPGVLNVITGTGGLGSRVTSHPGFDKISFTGSTTTGRTVMASAAANLARVTLELGGNDAAIVLPDVDVKQVAPQLFWAAFANTGQICLATKRLYIHADIYDALARELAHLVATVTLGDPAQDENVELGPVSNLRQYQTVVDLLNDCRDQGYPFLSGGLPDPDSAGYFIRPTLVDNPPDSARIVREEQFGPVLPLLKYTDTADAVTRANDSEFGLGASVWGADTEAAYAVAQQLQAGTVWVNESMHLHPQVPFGGHKQSGIGVESGQAGVLAFTNAQTLTIKHTSTAA
ncbi:acyl-CoA reductase-like NAD-dependent aldehyde dehydrogenase [Streptacidiphilus sp. MAP12-16]|uniref:aldehyde dehydrogenase family protein n=1 Tax=Streptacidiphilus sp. MAP12-16 TaxID=3156300 RepID=UPI003516F48F